MSYRVDDFKATVVGAVFLVTFCAFLVVIGYIFGVAKGREDGYIRALDDIRLGKEPKYKLVKIAEKWVEVEK